jgi:hypothetical protein
MSERYTTPNCELSRSRKCWTNLPVKYDWYIRRKFAFLPRGLAIGFIAHLYTEFVTTSNYIAIANSHILQFTTACTKSSQSMSPPVVAWWRIPTMTFASLLRFLLAGDCPTTNSFRIWVTLWLVVYHQSVRLGTKPLEDYDQRFSLQLDPCSHSPYQLTDCTISSACNISTRTAHKTPFLYCCLIFT